MITKNDIEKLVVNAVTDIANMSEYSTTEKIVGKWIDGKPLYQKTINFGSLPNNTTKDVAHGVSNMGIMVECLGVATSSTEILPLPRVSVGTQDPKYSISLSASTTYIRIVTGFDRSPFSAYVTIRYTKTTD